MSTIFTTIITLEKMECPHCAGVFALAANFIKLAKQEARGFYCPYCKSHRGWWESEEERLRKKLDEKARELVSANCEKLKLRHELDETQRLKSAADRKLRRVNAGLCPCCKRNFTNLARHMKTKHNKTMRQADNEQVRKASGWIVRKYKGVFEKLASDNSPQPSED